MAAREEHEGDGPPEPELLIVLVAVMALATACAALPLTVTMVASGRIPDCRLTELIAGTVRVAAQGHWGDPASAYPESAGRMMPGTVWWWSIAGALATVAGAGLGMTLVRLEPLMAREALGRRPGTLRGSRPRQWARPRDLALPRKDRGFSLGRLDGRNVWTREEEHVCLVAPTRAGKTTRYVIPWLLEHDGPAIVTSTKRDVLEATGSWRESIGDIWIFDPFAPDSAAWSPLEGCREWSQALRTGQWLADASADGDSEIARYWRGEAAKLLAPLLHAAALADRGIADVLRWLDERDVQRPARSLAAAGALPAERQLNSVAGLDDRNRGTTLMSAGSVLAAYRFPEVAACGVHGLTQAGFLSGAPNTLYVVASERHQRLLAPLVVTVLSSLLHGAMERDHASSDTPRLRVLLDEAANIAPLQDMPRLLSQAAGHGIRIATVWQSLAQMQSRYRREADTLLANSTTKLFMGPVTDDVTRRYVGAAVGQPRAHDEAGEREAQAAARQLRDKTLVLRGDALPALVRGRPWWERRVPQAHRVGAGS